MPVRSCLNRSVRWRHYTESARERLAHELHDGVTQLLAAAHLQANTAKLLFAGSQAALLQSCLDDLAATTLQAEAELREYLLG